MRQDKSVKKPAQVKETAEPDLSEHDDVLSLNKDNEGPDNDRRKGSVEKLLVQEQVRELLSNEDIVSAVANFKADSEEQEIALDYANSHIQFLSQIVESDRNKGIVRSDVEIRDLVSHVNIMLKKKDEYLFITIVMYSPSHYREMQRKL